jgi:hypothetical protein
MHLLHTWSRWGEPTRYKGLFGIQLRQIRTCEECGKAQARHIDFIDAPDWDDSDEIGQ